MYEKYAIPFFKKKERCVTCVVVEEERSTSGHSVVGKYSVYFPRISEQFFSTCILSLLLSCTKAFTTNLEMYKL